MNERFLKQIQAVEARYEQHQAQREERQGNLERLEAGGDWRKVDAPQRILKRAASLGMADEVVEALAQPTPPALEVNIIEPMADLLERIIGTNDLLGASFLLQGAQVSRSIGRIVIRNRAGRTQGYGTGFMVSPRLMMTNNHVLNTAATAKYSDIEFNYYVMPDGRLATPVIFGLQPDVFFVTDERLDFTLVAVVPANGDGVEVSSRSWNPLVPTSGKAIMGERVNIIQHPGGEPQQLALRQNQIVDLLDDFIHYVSDTEQGSSGSPVFNDQWELAALHHAGVPARDDQNRILLRSGDPWDGSDATVDQISWIANEGTRISRIVAHMDALLNTMTPEQQRLYAEVTLPRPLLEDAMAPCPPPPPVEGREQSSASAAGHVAAGAPGVVVDQGTLLLNIPLRIQLSVGEQPSLVAVVPAGRAPDAGMPANGEMQRALQQLQTAAEQPYYDAAQDEAARVAYYAGIDDGLRAGDRFKRLSELVKRTHTTKVPYRTARLEHLYPWVDLHETENGERKLHSIYSGVGFSAEEAIRADLEIAAAREARLREALVVEGAGAGIEELLDVLEADLPFNCEHVVPQSWFGKAEPMKGDLHHLFACEPNCNSFRGNTPYYQFGPEEEVVRDACGRLEQTAFKFEPAAGKGPVARATLYFLLRYPGLMGDEARELQFERLPILLRWHDENPVTDYERHRNAAIYAVQGNRNPLIDCPEWAEKIDFELGFGLP